MTTSLTRQWGDGLTTRARHLIADIRYPQDGPSWLVCGCGTRLVGDTPEALAIQWRGHGGQVLEVHAATDPVEYSPGTKGPELMAALLAIRARCTCDHTPTTECPNYMPGDEENE